MKLGPDGENPGKGEYPYQGKIREHDYADQQGHDVSDKQACKDRKLLESSLGENIPQHACKYGCRTRCQVIKCSEILRIASAERARGGAQQRQAYSGDYGGGNYGLDHLLPILCRESQDA